MSSYPCFELERGTKAELMKETSGYKNLSFKASSFPDSRTYYYFILASPHREEN